MRAVFGLNAEPGGRAYVWANRISWCVGIFASLFLFALVPHWYIALPVALFGCWVTTSLCGLLWYELREALNCTDRLHRIMAAVTLIIAAPVGLVAFCLVPNWSDFDFNGHPSLVAVAGSMLLGILSFILTAGVVAFLGVMFSGLTLRFLRRSTHSYKEGTDIKQALLHAKKEIDSQDEATHFYGSEPQVTVDISPAEGIKPQYDLIKAFFKDPGEYMNFFLKLKEARLATSDFSCIATLEKEDGKYLYTLEWKDGRYISEYVRSFRANEENVLLFNEGCAEMARRLLIWLETGDKSSVPHKPPAFGSLSCESPEEEIRDSLAPEYPEQERKYFPVIRDAREVRRYNAGTHEVVLLTDVQSTGIVRYTHLLIAFAKGEEEPAYVVAAEVNNLGSPGDGSHILGAFPGSGHMNYGCSDDWADLDKFEREALEIMQTELGIQITTREVDLLIAPTFTSSTLGAKFVLIPAGTFMMGESDAAHQVTISRPFYMQTTVVTQAQWQRVMGYNPSYFDFEDFCPVERVSWHDVQDFIRELNQQEGTYKYRLPTEAEWEYAARAGSTAKYSFGDSVDELSDYAWYDKNSRMMLHPAGQKKPNAWGLDDMHGNVGEWVQDWHNSYPSGSVTDPTGPSSGSDRVFRGGSWCRDSKRCTSSSREFINPAVRLSFIGFRLARTA